ncbi:hypothetical protein GF407_15815 [candidate division KSB1 bacterium]|nr:hypothetical protein [candidate division KSB1 bacterium]
MLYKKGKFMSEFNYHTEYRHCHFGGAVYLIVEGILWLLSAIVGYFGQIPVAMLILLIGGMFIHPIATTFSKLLKVPSLQKSNRLSILITWLSLTIPLGLPLIFMATLGGREYLFFPAFAVLVGAHWLPFTYVYSMNSFIVLSIILVVVGIIFGFIYTQFFAICGFFVGFILFFFALIHYVWVRKEKNTI